MNALRLSVIFLLITSLNLAQPSQPITPDNIRSLQPVNVIGRGVLLDVGLVQGESTLAAVTQRGVYLYPAEDLSATPTFIDFGLDEPLLLQASFITADVAFSDNTLVVVMPVVNRMFTVDLSSHTVEVSNTDAWVEILDTDQDTVRVEAPTSGQTAEIIDDSDLVLSVTTGDGNSTQRLLGDQLCGRRQEVFYTSDGSTLYVVDYGMGASIFALNAASLEISSLVGGFGAAITDFAFSPDSQTLIVAGVSPAPQCGAETPSNGVYWYDSASGELLNAVQSNMIPAALDLWNDLLLVGGFQGIQIWRGQEVVGSVEDENLRFVTGAQFSPNGQYAVFSTSNGELYVWDTSELEASSPPLSVMQTGYGSMTRTFAVTDEAVIHFQETTVHVFDLETQREIAVFDLGQPIRGLDYHDASKHMAVVTGALDQDVHQLTLYDTSAGLEATPQQLRVIDDLPPRRDYVRFSPDGALVVIAANASGDIVGPATLIYEVETGERDDLLAGAGGFTFEFNSEGTALGLTFGTMVSVYSVP